ncbi:MAG: hypothetical protein GWO81_01240 [Verrucomicrobia bacterium]|nr:hypothetical protein [Verrucomicrobiota bacterium]
MSNRISAILDEAKIKQAGQLWILNQAMLAYLGVYLLLVIPAAIIAAAASPEAVLLSELVFKLFLLPLLTYPLFVGILCLGIARARVQDIQAGAIFGHYGKMLSLYGFQVVCSIGSIIILIPCVTLMIVTAYSDLLLLMTVIIVLTSVLFFSLGIYLSFAAPLIADKGLGVIECIKRSFKAVHLPGKFFLLVRFWLLLFLWTILGLFTLGIAYFWIFPKYIIAYGILYRDLFDSETVIAESGDAAYEGPLSKYSQAQ